MSSGHPTDHESMLVFSILIIILSCLIIWRSSHGFELASDFLGRKLPAGIKGATINAIASSMPEFLTTMFFLFYLRDTDGFSGGLGVASGSALFNLLIIPALVAIVLFSRTRASRIVLNKKVLLREGLVLLLAQVLFINFLFSGDLKWWHGLVLLIVYGAYLLVLVVITRRSPGVDPGFTLPESRRQQPLVWKILSLDITYTLLHDREIGRTRAWLLLLVSTIIMTLGTWLLVYGTDLFGRETNIPLIFVAVILSASATSVPDTIISIKDARKGNYDDAISNALGSNIFDIAFALGLPLLLYNLVYGNDMILESDALIFTQEVWSYLLLATVAALVILLAGKEFNLYKAILLLGIYAVFLLFVATQVENVLPGTGRLLGESLREVADWIGVLLH